MQSILDTTIRIRLEGLKASHMAHFIAGETGVYAGKLDHLLAKVENHILERLITRRLKKVFSLMDQPAQLQNYLQQMRDKYLTGQKETLSVIAGADDLYQISNDYMPDSKDNQQWMSPTLADRPILLYVPGGGFILPPSRRQVEMVERLARACQCQPILGRHRLAPEAPFPAGAEDIAAQYKSLLSEGNPANKIFMAADTAGASLVMGAVQILRKQNIDMPKAILLFSPWCDLSLSGWSYITKGVSSDSPFRMESAAFCAKLYLQKALATDPLASAIYADLHGCPPIVVHTSEYDMHFDDAVTLVENAHKAGVESHINYWASPRHHLERLNNKDADKSFKIASDFIKKSLNQ
ncbi:MAG: alpha/beta hydrolase fold domain-containing protein [bacterium]